MWLGRQLGEDGGDRFGHRVNDRAGDVDRVDAFFCINRFFGTFEEVSYLQSKYLTRISKNGSNE